MEIEYENIVSRNVDRMMDKFFGDRDPSLKTITKMNLLYDGSDEMKEKMEKTLTQMKRYNNVEAYYIDQEMFLTYDKDGNEVLVAGKPMVSPTTPSFSETNQLLVVEKPVLRRSEMLEDNTVKGGVVGEP